MSKESILIELPMCAIFCYVMHELRIPFWGLMILWTIGVILYVLKGGHK